MEHYDIFISYKRKSLPTANNLYYRLTTRGYSTFFDLEEMRRDNFNIQLLNYIENAKDVFVILEEGSLDACKRDNWEKDWFCHEIAFALEKKKNIIPILLGDYKMPSADFFPDKLKELSLKHSPDFSFSFFEAYLDKLIEKKFITAEAQVQNKATSVFKFYSNENCQVFKEGKMVCSLEGLSDEPYYLPVPRKGDYRFKAVNNITAEQKLLKEHINSEEDKEIEIIWEEREYYKPDQERPENADNANDTQKKQLETDENSYDDTVSSNHDYIDLIEDVDNDYSAEQLYETGYNYYYGKGVEGDVLMAVNYLLSAAKMNHAKAQSFLYKCYCLGIGVDKDKNKALYWIKRSAENNDAESQLKYAKELIKLENYDDAAHWLETIVNNYYLSQSDSSSKEFGTDNYLNAGFPEQQHEISISDGKIVFDGKEVSPDNPSEEWTQYITRLNPIRDDFKEIAANAMLLLGEFYEKGLGKDIDITQAKRWYNNAEKQGNSEARNRLAIIVDRAKAKLIAQEVKEAPSIIPYEDKFDLAGRYITGRGINKNPETAVCLLKECSSHGMEEAAYELGRCCLTGTGIKRNDEMAYRLFEFAAKKGILEAQFLQGVMSEWGRGTTKDQAMALRLYSKSALKYYIPAIKRLSHCYQYGTLLRKDKTKASVLYEFARMIHKKDHDFFWDRKTEDDFLKVFEVKKEKFEATIADIKEDGLTVFNNNDLLLPYEETHGIDLGLTSGKIWADNNVGATEDDLLGLQFAWAETETKERFEWGNYFDYSPKSPGGFKDYKNVGTSCVYSSNVDPSSRHFGNNWITPSRKEMEELINECSWKWMEEDDFIGYELTGCTGRKIRIPLTNLTKCVGLYWCRTLDDDKSSKYAKCLYFDKQTISIKSAQRYLGLNVRPIMVKSIFYNVPILPFSSHYSFIFDDDLLDNR